MAEETLNTAAAKAAPATAVEVAPVEKVEEAPAVVCEKDGLPEEEKVAESASFKEESNVAGELPESQKKALDELKQLVQQALKNHEFSASPATEEKSPATEEKSPATAEKTPAIDEKAPETEEKSPEIEEKAPVTEEKAPATDEKTPVAEEKAPATEEKAPATEEKTPVTEEKAPVTDEKAPATEEKSPATEEKAPVTEEKAPATEDKSPAVVEEETKTCDVAAGKDESPATEVVNKTEEIAPEEVSIWGIPLLADERSDVVLLKFLRARDFKVKDAFTMLKNVVSWRKQFDIESLLTEDLGTEQQTVVYMHGTDKEGHPVCYNAYGEYQNKQLYNQTFSTEQNRTNFLRWRIQFLERSIRNLDFSPNGVSTIVQVIDFKNSPGPFKWELRQATNQALRLFQDNYPEFVAKQVFVNVPFLYLSFYKLISPFFTQRTKSKFVFAGPSKTAETLFKYIAPELVPVQYGGLSREGEQEFTTSDSVTEEIIKPATKHTIEIPAPESCTLVWEARAVGYELTYGAEFVPESADSYTVIVQKSRKVAAATDEPVISGQFKCDEPGKVVLTFDNQTSKKKKVLYRSKTKVTESIKC